MEVMSTGNVWVCGSVAGRVRISLPVVDFTITAPSDKLIEPRMVFYLPRDDADKLSKCLEKALGEE